MLKGITMGKKLKSLAMSVVLGVALAVVVNSADAANKFRFGLTGDAISLDPHRRLAAVEAIFLRMAYEGLTTMDKNQEPIPALAESWQHPEPNRWLFKLRKNVKFHGGETFDAEDVVFTLNRAGEKASGYKIFVRSFKSVKAIDSHNVEILTKRPDALLLNNLASVFIMDSEWSKKHGVEHALSPRNPKKVYSDSAMNGTGPFRLKSRKPDVKTEYVRNGNWWGWNSFPGNLGAIVIRPIGNAATRVATLLAGDLDLLTEIPVQDIKQVKSDKRFTVKSTAHIRTIFLSFNTRAEELATSNVQGKNPFRDIKVRQAVNVAINSDLIKKKIMRNLSIPTATLVPPGLAGYSDKLAKRAETNSDLARKLLTSAGYPNGFSVRLDCPNNRYFNDEAICQAVVSMLARIGIKISLNALPKDQWAPLVIRKKSDFYLAGFGTPTNDSLFMASHIFRGGPFHGGYKNAKINQLLKSAAGEMNMSKRAGMLASVFEIAKNESAIAPIHYQVINWAVAKNVQINVDPNNIPDFRYIVVR